MKGLAMTKQSQLKYDWIISTLYQSKQNNINIDAATIKAVFNIPLKDAVSILNTFNKGA
jgi:hypothetical protein